MKEEARHFPIMDGFDCHCCGAFFEELDFLKNLAYNAILTSGHQNNIIHHIIIVLLTNLLYQTKFYQMETAYCKIWYGMMVWYVVWYENSIPYHIPYQTAIPNYLLTRILKSKLIQNTIELSNSAFTLIHCIILVSKVVQST